jgi:protein phosphatase
MIEFGHLSHVGLRRELNEDTYYGDADLGLWLVADGMGGHDSGEVASAMARDSIVREVRAGRALAEAVRRANEDIIRQSKQRNESMPMGTTVVAVRVNPNGRFELAWVGDSRAYLWNGKLQQVSSDHSYVQELIDQGQLTPEQARSHPYRNVVTKALGVTEPDKLSIETVAGELRPGMAILLCSDGLTEEVDDAMIATAIAQKDISAQECVDHLIAAALDGGGSDNVTAVLLRRS